ncbi:MAG: dienelactone hydrolase family protein [Gammaproteobacteria bacterium]|nr:dienelactone hydrolase family protein [Gammaproteobacteria bacterium]MDP2139960.1 dienelactone hydrolase family protein [Gammaproteobacteria bacterium]MDP2347780.1 dienelactone hydrolase family protein [Gammaproteobacteria bacterium]
MRTLCRTTFAIICLTLAQCQSANGSDSGQSFISAFLSANSLQERDAAASQLVAITNNVESLYRIIKAGPAYSADVPRGELQLSRIGSDRQEYPYVVLVPDNYNPRRTYPVEFNLHGGVGRPKPLPNEPLWRQGYGSLRAEDRIVVVPAAWDDAYWWFENQAENLPAILRSIKRTYNVDDNRVFMTGVSDGGTGSYFFAFMQPTEWAAFLPYIGNPGVLRNPAGVVTYALSFENLLGKPLYIVNGENDPLYPASSVQPYIDYMEQSGVDYRFTIIPNGGHDTRWLPEKRSEIEAFKRENTRDPLPNSVRWVTNNTGSYNRNHWLLIDELRTEGEPGRVIVTREDNTIDVQSFRVRAFTLLLNPEEIDFDRPLTVRINGTVVHDGLVQESSDTLLKWFARDQDRTMLFTAELNLQVPE